MPKKAIVKKLPTLNLKYPKIKLPFMIKLKNVNWKRFLPKTSNQVLVALLVMAAFLLGVLFTKVQYLEKNQALNQQPTAQNLQPSVAPQGQKVKVDVGSFPIMGDKNAKVTVIEFADYQCPFCEKWFTDSEANLIKDYVNTGKVKFAFRDFAFLGQESTWAAEAASCANEQDKFWQYHDYLYQHQGQENSSAFSKDNLKAFAATIGLNTEQFNSCLDTDKYAKAVSDDTTAGQNAGVSGTPTTFVNGISMVGAQPYSDLKTLIDQELSKAK